jgi:hypothetical protein
MCPEGPTDEEDDHQDDDHRDDGVCGNVHDTAFCCAKAFSAFRTSGIARFDLLLMFQSRP